MEATPPGDGWRESEDATHALPNRRGHRPDRSGIGHLGSIHHHLRAAGERIVIPSSAGMRRTKASSDRTGGDDLGATFRLLAPWFRRRLAGMVGGGRADVDDVMQESFIRFGRYDAGSRNQHPKALLMRIASNVTRDQHRRSRVRAEGHSVSLVRSEDDEGAFLTDPELLIDLKDAIVSLPKPLRDTFLLARFTPMTNDEIAQHLGVSTKTVEWRISRAVSFCMQRLER